MATAGTVEKLYRSVIDDVVNNVREAFLDEGVDEQILIELKQIWEKKLKESKAVEQREPEVMTHVVIQTATDNHSHSSVPINVPPPAPPPMTQSAIAHQLTIPPNNLMQQALLQYAATSAEGGHDGQKTVTLTMPQKLTITLPAQLAQSGLQTVMSAPAAAATLALPPEVTASLLQQAAINQGGVLTQAHTLQANPGEGMQYQTITMGPQPTSHQQQNNIIQLDGAQDSSEDDDEEEDFPDNEDDRDNEDNEDNDEDQEESGEDDDPLNSEDDVSDNDPTELFDTENVVVCQYDKITRSRNRWKLHLKDGIMNLQGKDFVFQKAVGDAEW